MSEPGILPKPIPFGKYYLLERVNVGGMAEIFKAKAFGVEGFERLLAVKQILSSIAEDESFIKMFIDEAKIAGQLNHPNIAQIFDLGKVDGSYFIALEYISGKDLKTSFERARRIGEKVSIPKVCYTIMKVCEGLAHAHDKKDAQGRDLNIVHRDVSPQNVLISYEGEVKIIDFGIAKAQGKQSQTQVGILKGKFSYMSPEQVRGLHVDHRSDLFSLGIVLYELLTLERLFLGESDFDTLEKIRKVEMSPPSLYNPHIPKELEDIVLKSLARTPEERFQSASDFAEAIEKFMRSQGHYFTNKDMAAYMKESFSADIEFENKKLGYYRSLNLQPLTDDDGRSLASQRNTPHQSPAASRGGGLSWGEEEMETQIFDRVDEEDIGESDIIYADDVDIVEEHGADSGFGFPSPEAPTVEFERWDKPSKPDNSLDLDLDLSQLPAPRSHPTATMPAIERRSQPQATVQSPQILPPRRTRKPWIGIVAAAGIVVVGLVVFFMFFQPDPVAELNFTVELDSVQIYINDELVHDGATPFHHSVAPGETKIVVHREGFHTWEKLETLSARTFEIDTINFQPKLSETTGVLVKTEPAGAKITLGEEALDGLSPVTANKLKPGSYTVKIALDGFFEETREVTVTADEIFTLEVPLRPSQVALTINSSPDRADFSVFEAGSDTSVAKGRTPETVKELDASKTYRVVIDRRGHDTFEQEFKPGLETEAKIDAELTRTQREEREPVVATHQPVRTPVETKKTTTPDRTTPPPREEVTGTGVLNIASRPVARVFINDKDTGRYTPLIEFKIKAGKHKIGLVNDDFGLNKTYYVDLAPGESKRIINR